MQGWIKLHRQFTEWEWYTDDKCFRLFIHLLLKCNHKTIKWRGEKIERGQTITSIGKLAIEVGMTPQTLRTTLKKLESTGEINKQSTSKLTKITVCNYSTYQEDQQTNQHETNKPLTNDQQTTNKPLTTNKNDKKENNDNNDKKKTVRHKHGKYSNVLLSDVELEKLKEEFAGDYESRIEKVSEYCESTGKSYKNYLATIRSWAKKDKHKPNTVLEDQYANAF